MHSTEFNEVMTSIEATLNGGVPALTENDASIQAVHRGEPTNGC
jgi:hypothetical protein